MQVFFFYLRNIFFSQGAKKIFFSGNGSKKKNKKKLDHMIWHLSSVSTTILCSSHVLRCQTLFGLRPTFSKPHFTLEEESQTHDDDACERQASFAYTQLHQLPTQNDDPLLKRNVFSNVFIHHSISFLATLLLYSQSSCAPPHTKKIKTFSTHKKAMDLQKALDVSTVIFHFKFILNIETTLSTTP